MGEGYLWNCYAVTSWITGTGGASGFLMFYGILLDERFFVL